MVDLKERITNDYLSCPICIDKFKDPRRLSCNHTFCYECLDAHIKERTHPACPLCNSSITAPNPGLHQRKWAEYFPVDSLVITLLRALVLETDTEKEEYKCDIHTEEPLGVYCLMHERTLCYQCAFEGHQKPKCNCVPVEEAAATVSKDLDYWQTRLNDQIESSLESTEENNKTRQILIDSKARALERLRTLDNALDEIRNQIKTLRELIDEKTNNLLNQTWTVENLLRSLQDTNNRVNDIKERMNPVEVLKIVPMMKSQIEGFEQALQEFKAREAKWELDVKVDSVLENVILSDTTGKIGDVIVRNLDQEDIIEKPSRRLFSKIEGSSRHKEVPIPLPMMGRRGTIPRSNNSLADGLTFWRACRDFNVDPSGIKCQIRDIIISKGVIYILDVEHNKMVRFTSEGTRLGTMYLDFTPYHCTDVGGNALALTTGTKRVVFVSTEPILRVSKCIKTAERYTGICFLGNGKLGVTRQDSMSGADIINTHGQILTRLAVDAEGNSMFVKADRICATSRGNIVVSDEETKIITCIHPIEGIVWEFSKRTAIGGICCFKKVVYVCLRKKNKVIRLDEETGKMLSRSTPVPIPSGVALCDSFAAVTQYRVDNTVPTKIKIFRFG